MLYYQEWRNCLDHPSGDQRLSLKGNGSILFILAAMAMMVMFIEIMLVPALPHIAIEFQLEAAWVSWVLSAYLLSGAVTTLLLGRLGDIHGKKKVMLLALFIYIVGLLGCAFSWSMTSLIAFRAVQGVGMGVFVLAYGIIRDTFPRPLVPVAIGMISAMFSVGVSIGLLGGGWIVSNFSWRDAFYIVIPLMVLLTLLTWRLIRDTGVRAQGSMDVTGAFLVSGGVLSLLLALTQGDDWGWVDGRTLGLIALSPVLIIAFVWWERSKARTPIVSIKLMRNRGIAGVNIAALFVGLCMFMFFQTLPFFLQTPTSLGGFGIEDAFLVGLYMFPSAVAQLIFAPLAGRWSKEIGADKILIIGMGVTGLGTLMMAAAHTQAWEIMVSVFVTGVGMGFSMVSLINVVAMSSRKEEFGVASGMNTLFRVVGGSVGPVLAAAIMTSYAVLFFPSGSPVPVEYTSESGYTLVWTIASVFSFIGMALSLIMRPGKGLSYEEEHHEPIPRGTP